MADKSQGFGALRAELDRHGVSFVTERTSAEDIAQLAGTFRIPIGMMETYSSEGPAGSSSVPWIVEDLRLYSLRELPGALEGYAWTRPQREELPAWPNDWVVIASIFGDPFVVDVADQAAPVYFARWRRGAWQPTRVALALGGFIDALTTFEKVLLDDFDGDAWRGGDLKEEFLPAVEDRLRANLEPPEVQGFMSTFE